MKKQVTFLIVSFKITNFQKFHTFIGCFGLFSKIKMEHGTRLKIFCICFPLKCSLLNNLSKDQVLIFVESSLAD